MKKIKYTLLIIINLFRFMFKFVFSFGHIRAKGVQLISLNTAIIAEKGNIFFQGRNHIEKAGVIKAMKGSIKLYGVYINKNCSIVSMDSIIIERGVTIGPNVCIYDHDHNYTIHRDSELYIKKAIHIKENVWIGSNAVVCKGVTIGKNSVIAAGAVIVTDVPENVLVGGVPARVIKHI